MTNSRIKVGIIGTGAIALNGHAQAITKSDRFQLVAVLSRDEQRGTTFMKQANSNGLVHTTIKAFVEDKNIDFVIVASPDFLHYEQANACLQAGKHVLLEKPMTLENEQAEELARIAQEKNVTLAIGFHLRSHAGHRMLYERVTGGEIGALRHIRIIWAWQGADQTNWRADSSRTKWWSLSAVGSHCLDLGRWFSGDMQDFTDVRALLTSNVFNGPHDETAVVSAQFENGSTLEVTSSVLFGPYNRIELFGDEGRAVCVDTLGREGAGRITINDEDMTFEIVDPFLAQLENIARNIDTGAELNAPAEAGVRSVKDLNRILEE